MAHLSRSPPLPMPTLHECPMCGEAMRLVTREMIDRVPGSSEQKTTKLIEWVCPECDYFEEADERETTA